MEYYLDYYLNPEKSYSPKEKKVAVRNMLSKIAALSSGVERSHWLRELSFRSLTPEKDLMAEMEEATDPSAGAEVKSESPNERHLNRRDAISERIIYIASHREDLRNKVEEALDLLPDIYKQVFACIVGEAEPTGEVKEMLEFLTLHPGIELRGAGDLEAQELNRLLQELELEYLDTIRQKLRREVLAAERSGNSDVLENKLKEFDDITRKMQHIKHAKGGS